MMVYVLDLLDDLLVFIVFINFANRVEERGSPEARDLEKDA